MQTAIVHSRRPLLSARQSGLRGVAGFLLLIAGTPATFLAVPVNVAAGLCSCPRAPRGTQVTHVSLIPSPRSSRLASSPERAHDRAQLLAVSGAGSTGSRPWALLTPFLLAPALLRRLESPRPARPQIPSTGRKTAHGLSPGEVCLPAPTSLRSRAARVRRARALSA